MILLDSDVMIDLLCQWRIVGLSVAGVLADATGSFGPAFLTAAGVTFLGGVGSLLRPPRVAAGV